MAVSDFDYASRLHACAQGDEQAFQALYQQEAPSMLALGMKMLEHNADAQELVRDTFILIWKNAGSYSPDLGPARAWMYSILRYRALGRLRQPGRQRQPDTWTESLPAPLQPGRTPPTGFVKALAGLPDIPRRSILMAFYHGCTYEQLALRLKTPLSQLKAQVRAGLESLKKAVHA